MLRKRWIVVLVALLIFFATLLRTPNAPTPAEEHTVELPGLNQSWPQEMVIPSIGLRASFESDPCRVRDGALDPATLDRACIYVDPQRPYELPGPGAEDLTVVAGHTGAGVTAVFDPLYRGGHTVRVGDLLYLRTESSQASGGRWLAYKATDLHEPAKEGLANDTDVWGSAAMPGRLLTISCIPPDNPFADSVRNAVVGWQYVGPVAEAVVNL